MNKSCIVILQNEIFVDFEDMELLDIETIETPHMYSQRSLGLWHPKEKVELKF